MIHVEKTSILNCSIAKVSMSDTISLVESYVGAGRLHLGCGVNADQIVKINKCPKFKKTIHDADIVFADGMSVYFASKLLRRPLPARIGAIDLFEALLPVAVKKQYKIFLLGTKEEILIKAVDYYHNTYPRLIIAGYHHGYWSDQEEDALVCRIIECSPDFLFLGISSPKKEKFIQKYRKKLHSVSFALGVGGTFDIHAGVYSRAPIWMQNICLEWFWRLIQEPKRMFLRYTLNNLKFTHLLLKGILRLSVSSTFCL